MKILFIMSLLFGISANSYADNIDDLFSGGEDREFEFERFSEANVMEAIAHDAGMACKNGLCTLTSNDTRFKEFTINMNGGMGNNESGGFGGYGPGNGNGYNIYLPGNNNNGGLSNMPFESRLHANINIQLKVGSCTRTVKIPRSLYYAINRYMYGLMNEDSTTRRSFTPADEAMIMFYTTVMKEASACNRP